MKINNRGENDEEIKKLKDNQGKEKNKKIIHKKII